MRILAARRGHRCRHCGHRVWISVVRTDPVVIVVVCPACDRAEASA